MKAGIIPCFLISIQMVGHLTGVSSVKGEPVKYITEDHLVPRKPEIDGALRPVLEKKLFLTPADCALLLIRPPERGESAVAVYSLGHKDSQTAYNVTLTEAERNIDMALAVAGGEIDAVNDIRVKRYDASIPTSTALALRVAWQAMLERAKPPGIYARPTLHREEFEFSIILPNSKPLYATLPNKGGRSVAAFVRLGRLLAAYCKVPTRERPTRAKRIERDAQHFVMRLRNG